MNELISNYVNSHVNDADDELYGPGFRCSVELKDGTLLPCVIIRYGKYQTELALRRFEEEKKGKGVFGKSKKSYQKIVHHFLTSRNQVNDYDIKNIYPSKFAIPQKLVKRIEGETSMGWTGWVFEMTDGQMFSYGSSFLFSFFELPKEYGFSDVLNVHNHSFVDKSGNLQSLRDENYNFHKDYDSSYHKKILRERPYFTCYIEE